MTRWGSWRSSWPSCSGTVGGLIPSAPAAADDCTHLEIADRLGDEGGAGQLIVVEAAAATDTWAQLQAFDRVGDRWVPAFAPTERSDRAQRRLGRPLGRRRHHAGRHVHADRGVRQRSRPRLRAALPPGARPGLLGRRLRPRRTTTPGRAGRRTAAFGYAEKLWTMPSSYRARRRHRLQPHPRSCRPGQRHLPARVERERHVRVRRHRPRPAGGDHAVARSGQAAARSPSAPTIHRWRHGLTRNPISPVGSSSTTSTPVTSARGGPMRHHVTMASTAPGSPSNAASTRPSAAVADPAARRRRPRPRAGTTPGTTRPGLGPTPRPDAAPPRADPRRASRGLAEHVVGQAVGDDVVAAQDVVAVDVGRDALLGLAGALDQDLHHPPAHLDELRHPALQVGRLALGAAVGLVDQHPGVGQHEPLARGARRPAAPRRPRRPGRRRSWPRRGWMEHIVS